jgi:two-component system, chemotaxis family, protein-glutamate methylesterase/glutaminase
MISVIVVDDSFFMRSLISDMLNSEPGIRVAGAARNGVEAIEQINRLKPDVVTLDLVMPGLSGREILKRIMAECPTPVIVLSAVGKTEAGTALDCIRDGAVGFVLKPSGELSLDIGDVKQELLKEVKAAAQVNLKKTKPAVERGQKSFISNPHGCKIIIVGASTGGPQALETILPRLPSRFSAPVVIVQHMPDRLFTESLAERLDEICQVKIKVAEDRERIRPGRVYFAPAGYQMAFNPAEGNDGGTDPEVDASLTMEKGSALSPSIDVTMGSAAMFFKRNAMGIVLSGMGRDGLEGMRCIKAMGGTTLVQDESALIFGMPAEVFKSGLADRLLSAEQIPRAMIESVSQKDGRP